MTVATRMSGIPQRSEFAQRRIAADGGLGSHGASSVRRTVKAAGPWSGGTEGTEAVVAPPPVPVDFDIDLDRVRAFLRGKADGRRAQIDERFERATHDAQAIVAEIARVVEPRRIYQWGALLISISRWKGWPTLSNFCRSRPGDGEVHVASRCGRVGEAPPPPRPSGYESEASWCMSETNQQLRDLIAVLEDRRHTLQQINATTRWAGRSCRKNRRGSESGGSYRGRGGGCPAGPRFFLRRQRSTRG